MSTKTELPTDAKTAVLEDRFTSIIAESVGCRPQQISAAAWLFAEGSTVPFVARYRKEATAGLVDEQLEVIAKERDYFLELSQRRDAVISTIEDQGKLTPELAKALGAVTTKRELEDLYLPFKKKRRTRAQMARERGLEPLADLLLDKAPGREDPETLASGFVSEENGVADVAAALAGARDILAESVVEIAEHRSRLRDAMASESTLRVRVIGGKENEGEVYRDYFDHSESSSRIPSHRFLAILRGEREGFLVSDLEMDDDAEMDRLSRSWDVPLQTPCGEHVHQATIDGYRRLLRPSIENEVRSEVRERAESEAIGVFRENLEALLMQSPIGQLSVMGLDPGYRTGCKVAVVDGTGKVGTTGVIYPVPPVLKEAQAKSMILRCVKEHGLHAIAIGNGTGSRETEIFTRGVLKEAGFTEVIVAIVPETGASIYSSSALAREELPDHDVTIRGAVSIARRLQDPLAELVKIEPKSLGVGQYQHDVNQRSLSNELDAAVERIVNRVGVELNSASVSLLRRVSGLSDRLARNVVAHRDENGPFPSRRAVLKVAGFGPKTFELSAGFLRVRGGDHPLDQTAVHPERYKLVKEMCQELSVSMEDLVGNAEQVSRLNLQRYEDEEQGLGLYTLEDIKAELERPGRDPRPEFKSPEWRDDVQSVDDLTVGMQLEGRVSNVTNFGAFVDVGVKRDGLVHISELSDQWVADPKEFVKVGQIVKVKVLEVDQERGRVALSMKQA